MSINLLRRRGVLNVTSAIQEKILEKIDYATTAFSYFRLHQKAPTCMRIKRASDNAEENIGFSNGIVNVNHAESFCAGTDGFLVQRFDQSYRETTYANELTNTQGTTLTGWNIGAGNVTIEDGYFKFDMTVFSNLTQALSITTGRRYYLQFTYKTTDESRIIVILRNGDTDIGVANFSPLGFNTQGQDVTVSSIIEGENTGDRIAFMRNGEGTSVWVKNILLVDLGASFSTNRLYMRSATELDTAFEWVDDNKTILMNNFNHARQPTAFRQPIIVSNGQIVKDSKGNIGHFMSSDNLGQGFEIDDWTWRGANAFYLSYAFSNTDGGQDFAGRLVVGNGLALFTRDSGQSMRTSSGDNVALTSADDIIAPYGDPKIVSLQGVTGSPSYWRKNGAPFSTDSDMGTLDVTATNKTAINNNLNYVRMFYGHMMEEIYFDREVTDEERALLEQDQLGRYVLT